MWILGKGEEKLQMVGNVDWNGVLIFRILGEERRGEERRIEWSGVGVYAFE